MDRGIHSPRFASRHRTARMTSGPLTSGTECWCASTAILSQPGQPGTAVDFCLPQPSAHEGAR